MCWWDPPMVPISTITGTTHLDKVAMQHTFLGLYELSAPVKVMAEIALSADMLSSLCQPSD